MSTTQQTQNHAEIDERKVSGQSLYIKDWVKILKMLE